MNIASLVSKLASKFFASFVLIAWSGYAFAQAYTVTELSIIDGNYPHARGINAKGEVAGEVTVDFVQYATAWNGVTATTLQTPNSLAYGINAGGQIVGTSYNTVNTDSYATVWNGTTATVLQSLSGNQSEALAINTAGQIAGMSIAANISYAVVWKGTTQPPTVLATLGGEFNSANGINDGGQAVGYSSIQGTGVYAASIYAALWNGTAVTNLGALPGSGGSQAYGINNAGYIVGMSDTDCCELATLWHDGSITNLGALPGYDWSEALAINAAGDAVGLSIVTTTGVSHATLWSGGKIIDLNSHLHHADAEFITLTSATAINDLGSIVALGFDSRVEATGGPNCAFLLTPPTVLTVSLSPLKLSFPRTVVGSTSAPLVATLKNTGTVAVSITSIALTNGQTDDFEITQHTCGLSLAVGASCTVSVTFRPVAAGAKSASFTIEDDARGSQRSVALTGLATVGVI